VVSKKEMLLWHFFNLEDETVKTKLYETANSKPLGDVGHSMQRINGNLYIVLNNSGVVKVLDPNTFIEISEISGFTSPRYIQQVSDKKAYVTELFGNEIKIVDLTVNAARNSIKLRGMTERMAVFGSNVFIANNSNNQVFVVDAVSDALIDSIDIGGKCNEIWLQASKIIAIRNADVDNDIKGAIVTINPTSKLVEKTVLFESDATMWYTRSFATETNLYFLVGNKVMRYENGAASDMFELVNVNPNNIFYFENAVWICDAKDYQQTGAIIQYSAAGDALKSFAPGITPSQMLYHEF